MRIDPNSTTANEVAAEQRTHRVAANERARAQASIEDKATLSSDSIATSDLAAQALQTPAIRQDKVEALRRAIEDGTYKIDPASVAEAILKDGPR